MARNVRDDDDDETPVRSSRGHKEESKPARAKVRVSLSDDDAVDVGLFSSGPFKIEESIFAPFDYGGTSRNPPIVWLVRYSRGTGKEKEQYEQPYGIGKGWSLDKDGDLVGSAGQTSLGKTCNAIKHLVKPLRKALAKAGIEDPDFSDPRVLEGLEGEVIRVDQEERDIREGKGGRERDRGRGREDAEKKGPGTILEIREVTVAPWAEEKPKSKSKAKAKPEPEEEDEAEEEEEPKPTKKATRKPAKDDDEDADEAPKKSKKAASDDGDSDEDDLTEEAVEAILAVVEKGKVRTGDDLEVALEKKLKGRRNGAAIIDLATSTKFLKKEQGWVLSKDGKTIDAAD